MNAPPTQPPSPQSDVVGLSLFLIGRFDPHDFAAHLPLKPLFIEHAQTNSLTFFHNSKPPLTYVCSRIINEDLLKLSVPGTKSIPDLFSTLFNAIAQLPPTSRATWFSITRRFVDLGVNWTNPGTFGNDYDIPAETLKSLAELGLSLRISVYATGEAVEHARRELNEDSLSSDAGHNRG